MTNAYISPKSELIASQHYVIGLGKKILGIIFGLLSSSLYIWIKTVIPNFVNTFGSFGADLPVPTMYAIEASFLLIIVAVLNGIACISLFLPIHYKYKLFAYRFLVTDAVCSFFVLVFYQWAMYLPVAQIGGVI